MIFFQFIGATFYIFDGPRNYRKWVRVAPLIRDHWYPLTGDLA